MSALETVVHLQVSTNGNLSGGHLPNDDHAFAARHQKLRNSLSDTSAMEKYLVPRHVIDVLEDAAPGKLTARQVCGRIRLGKQ